MLDDSDDIHPLFHGAPATTEFKKRRKRIVRHTREAIEQYGMIERGARWLVCLSGGKDSYTLLAIKNSGSGPKNAVSAIPVSIK